MSHDDQQHPDDLPKMTVEENPDSVGAKEKRREERAGFRGREKAADDQPQHEDENEGLPSVNRKKGGNKLITSGGIIFIVGLGLLAIFAVQKPKPHKDHTAQTDQGTGNAMPPLVIPPAPQQAPQKPTFFARPEVPPPAKPAHFQMPKDPNAKPKKTWFDRKMEGSILVGDKNQHHQNQQPAPVPVAASNEQGGFGSGSHRKQTALGAQMEPTKTKMVSASVLPNRDFLITKGTSLDCALETAIDSSLPGITTCRLTRDVYSDNGRVLLLDRGSKLVGEYQGGVKQGQYRIFALWTRVETPEGVIINLNSPGTDALGRSGLTGFVDNHFWKRFGAAIMMSFINSGAQALANSTVSGGSGTNNFYGDAANSGNKVISKILDSTVNIPPTIEINQGAHIQVMVARDLDFSKVYGLEAAKRAGQ